MKITTFILIAVLFTGSYIVQSPPAESNQQNNNSFYTSEAKKVIDNKCYGCHSDKGKSPLAKNALLWDELPGLQKTKQVAELNEIIKVLDKNAMPPESAVKKYPEMKLSPEESKILRTWAELKAESLLK